MQRLVQARSQMAANVITHAFENRLGCRYVHSASFSVASSPPEPSSPEMKEAIKNAVKAPEKKEAIKNAVNAGSDALIFASEWFAKNGVSLLAVFVSCLSLGVTYIVSTDQKGLNEERNNIRDRKLKQDEVENKKRHEEHYIKQVEMFLSNPYHMAHNQLEDIPGLNYVARDEKRRDETTRMMSSPGGLTLLEGPSGCGKTMTVQHCLQDLKCPGVYFSVRDDTSGLPPLAAFAQAFGVTDLPIDISSKALDILRESLKRIQGKCKGLKPPVLVIDDVQQLLKVPAADQGGRKILEWCLGRAANGELTVLFVSSETVQHKMRQLSGFAARLSVPDTPFKYINPDVLKNELMKITEKTQSFELSEVDSVLSKIGTHMSDVRRLQRLRTERALSIQQALDELVREEARTLKGMLVADLYSAQQSTQADQKLRPLVAMFICGQIASGPNGQPVALNKLKESAQQDLLPQLAEPFRKMFKSSLVSIVVGELVERNLLRRSFLKGKLDESLSFHRPVLRCAFLELQMTEEFQRMKRESEDGVFLTK